MGSRTKEIDSFDRHTIQGVAAWDSERGSNPYALIAFTKWPSSSLSQWERAGEGETQ